jgi:hypothetical protein
MASFSGWRKKSAGQSYGSIGEGMLMADMAAHLDSNNLGSGNLGRTISTVGQSDSVAENDR